MEPIRRKRPFLPKTKTGCVTCKVRKVKCDEGKPSCHRCTSTGRKCDGYSRSPAPFQTPSIVTLATQPDLLLLSVTERRSFSFFQVRAAQQLAGQFHRAFWTHEVLQAAAHYPSVLHLVISLGAAYEGFESGLASMKFSRDRDSGSEFALRQCNRAIRELDDMFRQGSSMELVSEEKTCCILTASILFAYLASLQGNISQVVDHCRAGLKVLREYETQEQVRDGGKHSYPVSLLRLKTLLISIYGQVRTIVNDEALLIGNYDPLYSAVKPVVDYESMEEAHLYVESLFHNTQSFLQATDFHPPTTIDEVSDCIQRQGQLSLALESSCDALDRFSSSQPIPAQKSIDAGITILRVYHTLIGIRLGNNPLDFSSRERMFDDVEDRLKMMLSYCEELVTGGESGYRRPSCTSGLGVVLPLHTVAARCRSPRIRRKALELLLLSARRECVWDSVLTARIAEKTVEIEESGSPGFNVEGDPAHGVIVDDARVREVKVHIMPDKKASLEYITVGNWKRNEDGVLHDISW